MRYQFFLNPEENCLFREALNYGFVTFNRAQILNIHNRKPEGFGITQKIINAYMETIKEGINIMKFIDRHYDNNSCDFCLSETDNELYKEALFTGLFDRLQTATHHVLMARDMKAYESLIKKEKKHLDLFNRFTSLYTGG